MIVPTVERGLRRGRLLVDGDRRREPLDEVDVGLVHLAEELPGVGGERLDVAALALGEDRVERQAGLARAGQPGEDDEGVAREVERDVLEVVLAGATDDETVGHAGSVTDVGLGGRIRSGAGPRVRPGAYVAVPAPGADASQANQTTDGPHSRRRGRRPGR